MVDQSSGFKLKTEHNCAFCDLHSCSKNRMLPLNSSLENVFFRADCEAINFEELEDTGNAARSKALHLPSINFKNFSKQAKDFLLAISLSQSARVLLSVLYKKECAKLA
ncbi:hypothetical protein PGB90_003359 [Kerria lacca]